MMDLEKKLTPKEYPEMGGYCGSKYNEGLDEFNEKFKYFDIFTGMQNSGAFPRVQMYKTEIKYGEGFDAIRFSITVFDGNPVFDEVKEILDKDTTLLRKKNALVKLIMEQHVTGSNVGDLLEKVIKQSYNNGLEQGIKQNQKNLQIVLGLK